jgi:hypothetical protein
MPSFRTSSLSLVRKGAMLDSGIIVWIMLETTKRGGEAESESLCQLDGIPFLLLEHVYPSNRTPPDSRKAVIPERDDVLSERLLGVGRKREVGGESGEEGGEEACEAGAEEGRLAGGCRGK